MVQAAANRARRVIYSNGAEQCACSHAWQLSHFTEHREFPCNEAFCILYNEINREISASSC
jgi:hypothetical protein